MGRPGRGRRLPSGPGQSGREVADRLPRVLGRPVRGRAEATHGLRAHRAAAGAAARDPGAAAPVPLSKMRRDSRGSAAAGRGARRAVRRVDHYAALYLPYTQAISLQRLRGLFGEVFGLQLSEGALVNLFQRARARDEADGGGAGARARQSRGVLGRDLGAGGRAHVLGMGLRGRGCRAARAGAEPHQEHAGAWWPGRGRR